MKDSVLKSLPMKKYFSIVLYILAVFLTPLSLHAEEWLGVSYVIDGDTFIATNGEKVRLLDINTPETAKRNKPAQPYANAAKKTLTQLLKDKDVRLEFGKKRKDRYKRLLAHVYTKDGTWVNAEMIKNGLAHVYTFPDNRLRGNELLKIEDIARQNKTGMWQHKRWKVQQATDISIQETVGQFHLVQGTVKHIGHSKTKTFLNFGDNWRSDFTIEIPNKYKKLFETDKQPFLPDTYVGKTLLVRGIIKPVNGALITVTHPEQLTILSK